MRLPCAVGTRRRQTTPARREVYLPIGNLPAGPLVEPYTIQTETRQTLSFWRQGVSFSCRQRKTHREIACFAAEARWVCWRRRSNGAGYSIHTWRTSYFILRGRQSEWRGIFQSFKATFGNRGTTTGTVVDEMGHSVPQAAHLVPFGSHWFRNLPATASNRFPPGTTSIHPHPPDLTTDNAELVRNAYTFAQIGPNLIHLI